MEIGQKLREMQPWSGHRKCLVQTLLISLHFLSMFMALAQFLYQENLWLADKSHAGTLVCGGAQEEKEGSWHWERPYTNTAQYWEYPNWVYRQLLSFLAYFLSLAPGISPLQQLPTAVHCWLPKPWIVDNQQILVECLNEWTFRTCEQIPHCSMYRQEWVCHCYKDVDFGSKRKTFLPTRVVK